MTRNKLLYVFMTTPYRTAVGLETLEAVLIGASFEQEISLLFMHDGVFQLLAGQTNADINYGSNQPSPKIWTKTFAALPDFDVDNLYVHDLSLRARGLLQADLMTPVELLDTHSIRSLIAQQYRVFTF